MRQDEVGEQRVGSEGLTHRIQDRLNLYLGSLEEPRPGDPGGRGELTQSGGRQSFGVNFARGQKFFQRFHARLLVLILGPGFIVNETEAAAVRSQAAISVVDAQMQAKFSARGE